LKKQKKEGAEKGEKEAKEKDCHGEDPIKQNSSNASKRGSRYLDVLRERRESTMGKSN